MADYTISETFTLPSKAMVYSSEFNPRITLRSMNLRDEMRRQSPSDRSYEKLAKLIDDCIVENKPEISAYDMCMADYTFLLHKLRIVTYGSEYKMVVTCPYCYNSWIESFELDSLKCKEYTEEVEKLKKIVLPASKKEIILALQTPRMIDDVEVRNKEMMKKSDTKEDRTLELTAQSIIEAVDGQFLDVAKKENFVKSLSMRDINYLMQKAEKYNQSFGLSLNCSITCKTCGETFDTSFRYTSEFFRPTVD